MLKKKTVKFLFKQHRLLHSYYESKGILDNAKDIIVYHLIKHYRERKLYKQGFSKSNIDTCMFNTNTIQAIILHIQELENNSKCFGEFKHKDQCANCAWINLCARRWIERFLSEMFVSL